MKQTEPATGFGRRAAGALIVLLAAAAASPLSAEQRGPILTGVERVVAIGDLHGAYDNFVAILQDAKIKVLDDDLRWIGGKTHLVQIGDILDRGTGARKIFDLIRRLEGEAEAAGGRVHMLIGNHEAIALNGLSFDYEGAVGVEQFLAFLPDRYRQGKEAEFRRQAGPGADLTSLWEKLERTDLGAQSAYFEFLYEHYGRWIADHDTAVKIDGVVFVHGGFNEEYSRWPLERLNRAASLELLRVMANPQAPTQIIFDPHGPLWYRDDAGKDDAVMSGEIDRVLRNLNARALVVGHTATIGSRTLELSRMGGRVWTIDTGIWDPFSGLLGALIIEGGQIKPWGRENERQETDRRGRGRALSFGGAGVR
jgi:hypothetical protein